MRVLPLKAVHQRHPAFTAATAASSLEAARVCLDIHPQPPQEFQVKDDEEEEAIKVDWQPVNDKVRRAWGNNKVNSAIEDGACLCAVTAVELRRDLYAEQHAWVGSGIDYILMPRRIYVVPSDAEDLEEAWGLEVSGTVCGPLEVRKRLQRKLKQARRGRSNLPTLACVVGFKSKLIMMKTLSD